MAYLGDTGQGATLVFETSSALGRIRSMQLPDWVMEAIEATGLEDTGFGKKIPGDLTDAGEASITAVFDATEAIATPGTVETLTVTFPIGTAGNTTAATMAGTGFISTVGLPNMITGELMELTYTFTYDGDTGPAFTVESA
jgi:hypothetical protein